jgi:hypothetical protein
VDAVKYQIRFADTVVEHLRCLQVAERLRVLDAVEGQLGTEPMVETRNRKEGTPDPPRRRSGDSPMRKISLAKASRSLAQYAVELTDEIIVVTKGRCPFAALVPLTNVDRESLALSTHPEFMKLITRTRRRFAAGRTLDLAEMRTRVRRMGPPQESMPPSARKARRG